MKYDTIRWKNDRLELLDQTLLPGKVKYIKCTGAGDVFKAIRGMKVRGAPAIGIAGAFGAYLGARKIKTRDAFIFLKELDLVLEYLADARPTARNLFWALERIEVACKNNIEKPVSGIKSAILREAKDILAEDRKICRAIGSNGAKLIRKNSNILTHCNAGGLATGEYGTALGVIFSAKKKIRMVYADETRPVLQGARLTVWELVNGKVPVTLICDNMAASLMAKGEIDAIVVGADRIAANGDTANKIGTYSLAVLADYHRIPFYVAAPMSTFDLCIPDGTRIPIEERDHDEVRKIGSRYITCGEVEVRNPAFDVTPAKLITAIVTEKGVIKKPNKGKVSKMDK